MQAVCFVKVEILSNLYLVNIFIYDKLNYLQLEKIMQPNNLSISNSPNHFRLMNRLGFLIISGAVVGSVAIIRTNKRVEASHDKFITAELDKNSIDLNCRFQDGNIYQVHISSEQMAAKDTSSQQLRNLLLNEINTSVCTVAYVGNGPT